VPDASPPVSLCCSLAPARADGVVTNCSKRPGSGVGHGGTLPLPRIARLLSHPRYGTTNATLDAAGRTVIISGTTPPALHGALRGFFHAQGPDVIWRAVPVAVLSTSTPGLRSPSLTASCRHGAVGVSGADGADGRDDPNLESQGQRHGWQPSVGWCGLQPGVLESLQLLVHHQPCTGGTAVTAATAALAATKAAMAAAAAKVPSLWRRHLQSRNAVADQLHVLRQHRHRGQRRSRWYRRRRAVPGDDGRGAAGASGSGAAVYSAQEPASLPARFPGTPPEWQQRRGRRKPVTVMASMARAGLTVSAAPSTRS